jgi:TonB family protein
MEVTVAASHTDGANQFVEVMPVVPNDLLGSPVIDEKGELIGVVAAAASPGAPNIVRGTGAVEGLVSRISSNSPVAWAAAPPPPAESPSRPPMRTARIPVVQADRAGNSRLIFSPKPQFPAIGRNSTAPLRGDGRYRISFDASGRARNVQILQPSGSPELDAAATSTLSRWKAAPGQEWNATVPVTFQP